MSVGTGIPSASAPGAAVVCVGCGATYPTRLLACPGCRRLTHGAELSQLAADAQAATAAGDVERALATWRRALELLPVDSKQHAQIVATIGALGTTPASGGGNGAAATPASPRKGHKGAWVGLGLLGALLWKFKFLLVFFLTKAKFLLLGFTKIGTLFSAVAAFGLYWTLWGWKFALGFVLSIYVHEMGHVAALRRYGIPATAPMFIPGLGAFVRLKQNPANAHEDARIALGGPLWGLAAAAVAWAIGKHYGSGLWLSLAQTGALVNLFNLIPLGSLDGGRAFRALDRRQRWLFCALVGGAMLVAGQPLLILILLAAVYRAWSPKDAPGEPDRGAFLLFGAIMLALILLSLTPVPGAPAPGTPPAPSSAD